MTPFERAIAAQLEGITAAQFYQDLDACFLRGFVYSDADAFLMAYPVRSTDSAEAMNDPRRARDREDADAWFVYLAAGKPSRFFRVIPYPLKFACYERFGQVKVMKFSDLNRHFATDGKEEEATTGDPCGYQSGASGSSGT